MSEIGVRLLPEAEDGPGDARGDGRKLRLQTQARQPRRVPPGTPIVYWDERTDRMYRSDVTNVPKLLSLTSTANSVNIRRLSHLSVDYLMMLTYRTAPVALRRTARPKGARLTTTANSSSALPTLGVQLARRGRRARKASLAFRPAVAAKGLRTWSNLRLTSLRRMRMVGERGCAAAWRRCTGCRAREAQVGRRRWAACPADAGSHGALAPIPAPFDRKAK